MGKSFSESGCYIIIRPWPFTSTRWKSFSRHQHAWSFSCYQCTWLLIETLKLARGARNDAAWVEFYESSRLRMLPSQSHAASRLIFSVRCWDREEAKSCDVLDDNSSESLETTFSSTWARVVIKRKEFAIGIRFLGSPRRNLIGPKLLLLKDVKAL